jgi:AraC family transcriptional regulator
MRNEFDPETIRFTSDRLGFAGFRALVRELPDQGEAGTGQRGRTRFMFAYRPGREKGHTRLRFEDAGHALAMGRISSILPPGEPYVVQWHRAAGRIGSFEVHPRFFEQTLRRAGLVAARFRAVPPVRFVINRRVDWLCQLLMEETERGCPGGRAYFEHLAAALLLSVASQSDPRLSDAGDAGAQWQRVQQAVALMEANFASRLSLEQLAATSGLSAFHFSRLFRRVVGTSPHRYLLGCRLRHAQALLSAAGPGRSIAEVAVECGFADQSHFGRQFRRAYGVSPGQFRGAQGPQEQAKGRAQERSIQPENVGSMLGRARIRASQPSPLTG